MLKSISRQFGNPRGVPGKIVGYILAKNNTDRIKWLISEMNIKPDEKILEVGFGPGIAVEMISSMLTTGTITGADISEVMFNQALKRNIKAVKKGKIKLIKGTAGDINRDERFDTIFGMNVHIFWNDPVGEIKKLKQLLKNSGRLILALQPRSANNDEMVLKEAEKTKEYFRQAALKIIGFKMFPLKPQSVFYVAGKI